MHETAFDGIMNILKRRYKESFSDAMRQDLEGFMTSNPCPIKAALDKLGIISDRVRSPLVTLTNEQKAELFTTLQI